MTDCTTVKVTLLQSDLQKAMKVTDMEILGNTSEEEKLESGTALSHQIFYDVNYPNLEIEPILKGNKIPYTKSWEDGDDYKAGEFHFRIDEQGESHEKRIMLSNKDVVKIEELKVLAGKGFEAILALISSLDQEAYKYSWDRQLLISMQCAT